jgi:hypothetical protein
MIDQGRLACLDNLLEGPYSRAGVWANQLDERRTKWGSSLNPGAAYQMSA